MLTRICPAALFGYIGCARSEPRFAANVARPAITDLYRIAGPVDGDRRTLRPGGRAAARAAVKIINDAGGVLGRPLELIVADDETQPTAGAGCRAS